MSDDRCDAPAPVAPSVDRGAVPEVRPCQGAPAHRNGARVLLVEDEPTILRLFRTLLMSAGHDVTCCENGTEALRAFRSSPHAFDVVVSDVNMPGLDGHELSLEVFRIRPTMPVILMTGYSAIMSPHDAHALGLAAVLDKPIRPLDLLSAVAAAIGTSPVSTTG